MKRRRRRRKESQSQPDPAVVAALMLDETLAAFAEFSTWSTPNEAEAGGFSVLGPLLLNGESEPVVLQLIDSALAEPKPGAVTFLGILASLGRRHTQVRERATNGIATLKAAGEPAPPWIDVLASDVEGIECRRISHPLLDLVMLTAEWTRGDVREGATVLLDDTEDAVQAGVGSADEADAIATQFMAEVKQHGFETEAISVSPGVFRAEALEPLRTFVEETVENLEGVTDLGEEEFTDFIGAVMLMLRLEQFPEPTEADEAAVDSFYAPPTLGDLEVAIGRLGENLLGTGDPVSYLTTMPPRPELPPARQPGSGPAPVYRLRVDLRHAKPPIWRRLEVTGDTTLETLHEVLQVAFDWNNSHLNCFTTDYGEYGASTFFGGGDSLEDASQVTVEQVLGGVGDKISYMYDFGDSHDHLIKVEAILDPAPGNAYPRCTGGRRIPPPEDTMGFGLWSEQVEALADPKHEHHQDALGMLGLEPGDAEGEERRQYYLQILTAPFDAAEIDKCLEDLR
ncbi:plasmid pRiA4b ORF-3 family protein [Glycomyces sp. L485]|uniref:plasmid pRiA4b ORF-3 family protein n=1 Tax=Glycomyces sp. L485 TaxID=2909235 RepID=UPI001F4A1D16|nr:plasmid pRiA4b ORF-3 family protein [Glycomyces sp. L485]MCH7231074.1 plasmid pRiA4b ORF-3 family protein [Glycomyces sp. L485]